MSRYNKNLGDFGEDIAEKYLKESGYEVIYRNFLVKGGEIDIIAKEEDTLVFVEVKTRSSREFGYPSESVNYKKITHLKYAAECYMFSNPPKGDVRFDIIEVYATLRDGVPFFDEINHIKEIIID